MKRRNKRETTGHDGSNIALTIKSVADQVVQGSFDQFEGAGFDDFSKVFKWFKGQERCRIEPWPGGDRLEDAIIYYRCAGVICEVGTARPELLNRILGEEVNRAGDAGTAKQPGGGGVASGIPAASPTHWTAFLPDANHLLTSLENQQDSLKSLLQAEQSEVNRRPLKLLWFVAIYITLAQNARYQIFETDGGVLEDIDSKLKKLAEIFDRVTDSSEEEDYFTRPDNTSLSVKAIIYLVRGRIRRAKGYFTTSVEKKYSLSGESYFTKALDHYMRRTAFKSDNPKVSSDDREKYKQAGNYHYALTYLQLAYGNYLKSSIRRAERQILSAQLLIKNAEDKVTESEIYLVKYAILRALTPLHKKAQFKKIRDELINKVAEVQQRRNRPYMLLFCAAEIVLCEIYAAETEEELLETALVTAGSMLKYAGGGEDARLNFIQSPDAPRAERSAYWMCSAHLLLHVTNYHLARKAIEAGNDRHVSEYLQEAVRHCDEALQLATGDDFRLLRANAHADLAEALIFSEECRVTNERYPSPLDTAEKHLNSSVKENSLAEDVETNSMYPAVGEISNPQIMAACALFRAQLHIARNQRSIAKQHLNEYSSRYSKVVETQWMRRRYDELRAKVDIKTDAFTITEEMLEENEQLDYKEMCKRLQRWLYRRALDRLDTGTRHGKATVKKIAKEMRMSEGTAHKFIAQKSKGVRAVKRRPGSSSKRTV